jgi:hypothetical protein
MIGRHSFRKNRLQPAAFIAVVLVASACARSVLGAAPLPLTDHKSGISISLSGVNGADWAGEMTYHDEEIAGEIL